MLTDAERVYEAAPCPYCGARAGEPCYGAARTGPHAERIRRADLAAQRRHRRPAAPRAPLERAVPGEWWESAGGALVRVVGVDDAGHVRIYRLRRDPRRPVAASSLSWREWVALTRGGRRLPGPPAADRRGRDIRALVAAIEARAWGG